MRQSESKWFCNTARWLFYLKCSPHLVSISALHISKSRKFNLVWLETIKSIWVLHNVLAKLPAIIACASLNHLYNSVHGTKGSNSLMVYLPNSRCSMSGVSFIIWLVASNKATLNHLYNSVHGTKRWNSLMVYLHNSRCSMRGVSFRIWLVACTIQIAYIILQKVT